MRTKPRILCLLVLLIGAGIFLTDAKGSDAGPSQLPPIETFCLAPIVLENVSLWVPAAKTAPMINMACRTKRDQTYSSVLPATVNHTKTQYCPQQVARLLAEYTAGYHQKSMPLTIFNGWQWEYSYSLCQFDKVSYDLPARGGCWENCWEAILTQSSGSSSCRWLRFSSEMGPGRADKVEQKSDIDVKTFSSMRTRNGYPKKRQL